MTLEELCAIGACMIATYVAASTIKARRASAPAIARLEEMELGLAHNFADLLDGRYDLQADIVHLAHEGGHLVALRHHDKGDPVVCMRVHLNHKAGDWPLILALGQNPQEGYDRADQETLEVVARRAIEFAKDAILPKTIH